MRLSAGIAKRCADGPTQWRGFFEYAERELECTRQAGGKLSCLLLDIDFFKKINDAHGHSAGDVVLRQFAARLQGASRPENIIGRIGGEEFCVLLPGVDETGARFWPIGYDRRLPGVPFH